MSICVMCKQGEQHPGKVPVTHEKGHFFIAMEKGVDVEVLRLQAV